MFMKKLCPTQVEYMKLFIDSSLIIEYCRGNLKARDLMDFIEQNKGKFEVYINPSVWADVIYVVNKKYNVDLKTIGYYLFLNFKILDITQKLVFSSFSFIQKYKLDPSEAMVLGCCREYGIKHLLSLNNDFIKPAEGEKITHINALGKLKLLSEDSDKKIS